MEGIGNCILPLVFPLYAKNVVHLTGDGSPDTMVNNYQWRMYPGNDGLSEPLYVLPD